MGSLFDQLQKNAKIAKEENKELEQECSELEETRGKLEKKVLEIKNDETEH